MSIATGSMPGRKEQACIWPRTVLSVEKQRRLASNGAMRALETTKVGECRLSENDLRGRVGRGVRMARPEA